MASRIHFLPPDLAVSEPNENWDREGDSYQSAARAGGDNRQRDKNDHDHEAESFGAIARPDKERERHRERGHRVVFKGEPGRAENAFSSPVI